MAITSLHQCLFSSAQLWSLSCDNSLAAFWDLKGVKLISIGAHCSIFFHSRNAKTKKKSCKVGCCAASPPTPVRYWIPQPLHLMIALQAEVSVPGCIWFPYIPAGGPTRSVVHLSLMLHDESLINSCNLGTEAVAPSALGNTLISIFRVPRLHLRHGFLCFSPGRSGQVRGKSQPSHADRIALTHRRRKNKTKKSSFIASEMLRCLGWDSVKVVVRGSTVLAGYRSDMTLSEGIKELAKLVYVTLKSLLSVHSVPREREREMCVCYQTAFVLSFVFLIFFETLRNEKKNSHSGRSTLLGECFASQMIHKSFFQTKDLCWQCPTRVS